jgi:hypothetical protein
MIDPHAISGVTPISLRNLNATESHPTISSPWLPIQLRKLTASMDEK